jgi:hypothetical protein
MANAQFPERQKQHLDNLLQKLTGLIKKLPASRPCGTKDGPIATYFSSHEYDITEGPYFTFNQAWECVFQRSESEKEHLVIRGKYGLEMVQAYLACFLNYPGIEKDNGLQLIAQRVEALIALIEVVYVAALSFKSICTYKLCSREKQGTTKDGDKASQGKKSSKAEPRFVF